MSREKSYIMTQLDGNNHSVFSLNYHLILITKYRKEVVTDVISEYLRHIFCYIAPKYKITLSEWNHDKDHIHILFKAEPDSEISKFINAYKAASSRLVKKDFPEIRNKLWKEYFWSRSYCLITAGERTMMEEKVDTIIVSKCMEFRIKPTMEQKILIWKTFGCCRFVWNHLLDERISYEKVNKGKLLNTTPAHLKKDNPFLSEVDSMALINTQLNLNQACKKLFAKGKAPKFRAKGKDRRSYTTNWINNNIEIVHKSDIENYIKLPKLGRVRIISTVTYRMSGG